MNQFGLLAIGLLLGLILAAGAAAMVTLAILVYLIRRDLELQRNQLSRALSHTAHTVITLEGKVTSALAGLDATQLHAASQGAQQAVKKLVSIVSSLAKMVYADGSGAGLLSPDDPDYTPGMDPAVNAGLAGMGAMTEDMIEAEQARGITNMDKLAWEQARNEGRRLQREEAARMKAERESAISQQVSQQVASVLDPEQAVLLARSRDQLLRAGLSPLTVLPETQLGESKGPPQPTSLPDFDPAFTFTEGD